MKRTLNIILILLLLCTSAFAQKTNKALYLTAYNYFKQTLAGNKPELPLANKYGKTDSATIWKAWQDAVASEQDGLLAEPDMLASATGKAWSVPQALEPNATLNYYYGTKGVVQQGKSPLFIYLHGSGARADEWETGLVLCNKFDDGPSTYFIPQIPQEGEWYRWYQQSKQWFLEKVMRQSMARGDIDPLRIYFFGISEGGYGSQRLASFYADYLAGAGPMAGGEPLKNAPAENCSNIAFSLLTGEKDYGFYRNILTGYTLAAFDSLQALYPNEYNHNIKLIPGMGHGINYGIDTPWLKQFSRNPWPKHFIWEDYEMHNKHRTGFYNIIVNERPHKEIDKRTRYEMTIHDNTIDITVQDITYTCTQKDPNWGIEMKFERSYSTSTSGNITLLLNDKLVNLKKKVTVNLNGKKTFEGIVKTSNAAMLKSLSTFGDPLRIFPAAIDLQVVGND